MHTARLVHFDPVVTFFLCSLNFGGKFWGVAFHCTFYFTPAPVRVQTIAISASVCLSVHLLISKPHLQTSLNLLYLLIVAVAWFSSDDNAISCVLPVLKMTSCFHIMGQIQMQASSLQRSRLFIVTCQQELLNCLLTACFLLSTKKASALCSAVMANERKS